MVFVISNILLNRAIIKFYGAFMVKENIISREIRNCYSKHIVVIVCSFHSEFVPLFFQTDILYLYFINFLNNYWKSKLSLQLGIVVLVVRSLS